MTRSTARVRRLVAGVSLGLVLLGASLPRAARAASVSGFVRNAADGEALRYVNVTVQDSHSGAMTNAQGFYTIPGFRRAHTLVFSRREDGATSRSPPTTRSPSP
jgi:hypothetical protein